MARGTDGEARHGDFREYPYQRAGTSGGITTYTTPTNYGAISSMTFNGTDFWAPEGAETKTQGTLAGRRLQTGKRLQDLVPPCRPEPEDGIRPRRR